jgi:carboxyl-terminal processing protease
MIGQTQDLPPRARGMSLGVVLVLMLAALLFAAVTFVAGLALGSGSAAGGNTAGGAPVAEGDATPAPTAEPMPELETVTCTAPSEAFALLCETYQRIKGDYVDPVDDAALVEGAVRGMVEYGLDDPYSGYLEPETYDQALDDLSGSFSGIGAEVGIRNLDDPEDIESCDLISTRCPMVIIAPLEGTPAEAAGLRPGDIVLAIDGEPVDGSTLQEQVFRVRGEAGTDVTLTIRRGEEELELTITRAEIELIIVSSRMLDGGVGYVRLSSFSSDATGEFRGAIQSLFDQGAQQIVLDLRNNPGGYITAAQEIASEFVADGLLFTQESGEMVREWRATGNGIAIDPAIEVAVLVNGGSASASEIVAAALQEMGRATIVGEPTFGKNTVQVWGELSNNGGLRLTTDRWFTPSHDTVEGTEVQPDVAAESEDDTIPPEGEEDPILERALEVLGE